MPASCPLGVDMSTRTPDAIPVISPVDSIGGVFVAAGCSGHGFGAGPGIGHLAADLVAGDAASVDPTPFRLSRFTDRSKIEVGALSDASESRFWQLHGSALRPKTWRSAVYGAEELEETAKLRLEGRQKRTSTRDQVDELVQTSQFRQLSSQQLEGKSYVNSNVRALPPESWLSSIRFPALFPSSRASPKNICPTGSRSRSSTRAS